MNDTEQKLNSLKNQLEVTRRKENEIQNEIEKLMTFLEKNLKVGDCFEHASSFIRIIDIDGKYVKYMALSTDIEREEVYFDYCRDITIDFLLSTYTKISEECFLRKLNECVKTALEIGTKINTK